jgi:hypothetical protein
VTSGSLHPSSPWGSTQRVVLSVGWTLALCAVGFAWFATSGEAVLDDQVGWVAVAAAGVMLAGAVSGAWLLAGRRAVGLRARDALPVPDEGQMADVVDLRVKAPAVTATATPAQTNGTAPVAASGMRHFHRLDCPLAQGKAVAAAALTDHAKAGRTACEVCQP